MQGEKEKRKSENIVTNLMIEDISLLEEGRDNEHVR